MKEFEHEEMDMSSCVSVYVWYIHVMMWEWEKRVRKIIPKERRIGR